jgi:ABC-type enterochelin transport system substrate-binding protein
VTQKVKSDCVHEENPDYILVKTMVISISATKKARKRLIIGI